MNREFPWSCPFHSIGKRRQADSTALRWARQAAMIASTVTIQNYLDLLESFDDQRFGKAVAGPFGESRQRQHRIDIRLRFGRDRDRITAEAMHHWRKHRIRAGEGAEQKWPLLAVARMALGPDLLNPRHIGARVVGERNGTDRAVQVHAAFVAKRHEPR